MKSCNPWSTGTRKSSSLVITSVGVLMFCAKRCGEHFAKFSRAFALVGGSAELPIREPQLFGRERHGLEVEHAVVA